MVELFWLDLWEIFFLTTPGFQLGSFGSLVLHSTTVPQELVVFISNNFRYLTRVQRDWWWYCPDWTCERFSFWPHQGWTGDLWISGPALYHCTISTFGFHLWQFQVFNSGAERLVVVLFWLDLWEIFFLTTPGFELGSFGSLVLHSTTVPQELVVFISKNFRYLTLVQRDWWWYCSDWTCEIFSFWPHQGWTGDLWFSGPALYHCTISTFGFHLWQFQVFNCGAERMVVVLFWLDLWEIFFLATPGFELGSFGSLVLHSTTVQQEPVISISNNFRYLTLVQRDWWWYCSDWTCERFSFWPHQGLNWGPLDLYSCTLPRYHGNFWFSQLKISGI